MSKQVYQYYEWDDPMGWFVHFKEILEHVCWQRYDWRNVYSRGEVDRCRVVVLVFWEKAPVFNCWEQVLFCALKRVFERNTERGILLLLDFCKRCTGQKSSGNRPEKIFLQSVRVTSGALFFAQIQKNLPADLKSAVLCPDIMRGIFQKWLVDGPFPVRISGRQKFFCKEG